MEQSTIRLICKRLNGQTYTLIKAVPRTWPISVLKEHLARIEATPQTKVIIFHGNRVLLDGEVGDYIESDAEVELAFIPIDVDILSTEIYQTKIGQMWSSRTDLLKAGIHTELVDSISGHPKKCAHSIIYSGENELDEDQGQKIQFTVLGSELTGMKEALARNCPVHLNTINGAKSENFTKGIHVRVVRQFKLDSPYENDRCYKYDGVYTVSEYRPRKEKSGRCVWLFTLERDDNASNSRSNEIFRKKRLIKESAAILVNPSIANDEILFCELDSNIEVGQIFRCGQNLTNVKLLQHRANGNSYSFLWNNEIETDGPVNIIPFTVVSAQPLNNYIKSLSKKFAMMDFNKGYITEDLASAPDVKVFKKMIDQDISSIRYDGTFKLYAFWTEVNKSGLKTWRYLLKNATIPVLPVTSSSSNSETDIPIGTIWNSRAELAAAKIHCHNQAGICGISNLRAYSIVLSGEYEGDVDIGHIIVYTGCGGRDQKTNKRNKDQSFSKRNEALARNCHAEFDDKGAVAQTWKKGVPVRVVRKFKLPKNNPYIRDKFFRFDGMYKVVSYWSEKGIDTYKICRFLLKRDDSPST